MAKIQFKTKILKDQFGIEYIKIPKIKRIHCDINSFDKNPKFRPFTNSSLFDSMIQRELRKMGIEGLKEIKDLPSYITVERGFLSTITINL